MFRLEITTDNDAFADGELGASEVARILVVVAAQVNQGGRLAGDILDINGNLVGDWDLMP